MMRPQCGAARHGQCSSPVSRAGPCLNSWRRIHEGRDRTIPTTLTSAHLGQNLSETGPGRRVESPGFWGLSRRPLRPALRAYCVPGGGLDPTHTACLQRLRHPGSLRPPPPLLTAAPVSMAAVRAHLRHCRRGGPALRVEGGARVSLSPPWGGGAGRWPVRASARFAHVGMRQWYHLCRKRGKKKKKSGCWSLRRL